MVVEKDEPAASAQSLMDAYKACEPDRQALQLQIEAMLQKMWTESIFVIEEILKNTDPGNRKLFGAYRSRILNAGNQLRRQIPSVLGDYLLRQFRTREVVTKSLPKNGDAWGLPAGVSMPVATK